MNIRTALAIPALALAFIGAGATVARAGEPLTLADANATPDYVFAIAPEGMSRAIPKRVGLSDFHCYSARTGRAFQQVNGTVSEVYYNTRKGRPIAGYDRQDRTFYNFTRSIIVCAAWKG